jgi:hypothetical protein
MNRCFSFRLYLTIAAASVFLISALCFVASDSLAGAGQGQDRILNKRSWPNEPVKIKLVKTKRGAVKLGEKFSDGDDWFKGLRLTIQNVSAKPIAYLSVELGFLRPENETGFPLGYTIQYGRHSPRYLGRESEVVVSKEYRPIPPGGLVDITISDQDYDIIKSSLAQAGFVAGVKTIDAILGEVIFDDGSSWKRSKSSHHTSKLSLLKAPAVITLAGGRSSRGPAWTQTMLGLRLIETAMAPSITGQSCSGTSRHSHSHRRELGEMVSWRSLSMTKRRMAAMVTA